MFLRRQVSCRCPESAFPFGHGTTLVSVSVSVSGEAVVFLGSPWGRMGVWFNARMFFAGIERYDGWRGDNIKSGGVYLQKNRMSFRAKGNIKHFLCLAADRESGWQGACSVFLQVA